tara:strand:+ start:29 stop:694 length:666 start_codon:yes stop_codon:yes gene_type:complete
MNFQLYNILTAYGDQYKLSLMSPTRSLQFNINQNIVMQKLQQFNNDWTQYNPRKVPNNRYALSITNIDGKLGPGPDLDSLLQYNREHGTTIGEFDFVVPTPVYDIFAELFEPFKQWLLRCHVIQLRAGGFFPPHIDNYGTKISSFRLLIPLKNCNPPKGYFILDDKILHWEHGYTYFLNTCKQHIVFNPSGGGHGMTFVVLNVILNESSIKYFSDPEGIRW